MKILFGVLFLISFEAIGQRWGYVKAAVGTYQMSDLKALQVELLEDYSHLSIPVEIVSSFPVSVQFEAGLDFQKDKFSSGAFINYTKTRGLLHYADYSGEILSQQTVHRVLVGCKMYRSITNSFNFYADLGGSISFLEMSFETNLTGLDRSTESLKFNSLGISLQPGLEWQYIWKKTRIKINGGYEIGFNGKTNFNEEDGAFLINDRDEPVILDWSGLRFGIELGLLLRGNLDESP